MRAQLLTVRPLLEYLEVTLYEGEYTPHFSDLILLFESGELVNGKPLGRGKMTCMLRPSVLYCTAPKSARPRAIAAIKQEQAQAPVPMEDDDGSSLSNSNSSSNSSSSAGEGKDAKETKVSASQSLLHPLLGGFKCEWSSLTPSDAGDTPPQIVWEYEGSIPPRLVWTSHVAFAQKGDFVNGARTGQGRWKSAHARQCAMLVQKQAQNALPKSPSKAKSKSKGKGKAAAAKASKDKRVVRKETWHDLVAEDKRTQNDPPVYEGGSSVNCVVCKVGTC